MLELFARIRGLLFGTRQTGAKDSAVSVGPKSCAPVAQDLADDCEPSSAKSKSSSRLRAKLDAMRMRWIEEEAQAKKAAAAKRAAAAEKSARKLAAEKSRPDLQMQFFRKHAKTLYYKRRALFAPDEYGKRKPSEWNQEVERFLTVVTPARFRPKGREEKLRAKKQLLKIVNEFASTLEDEGVALKDPLEFERYCADLLSKAGWKAGTTKRTGDQGVDVIAEKGGKTLILQCKLYSQPVGNKAVQEALSGMRFVGADLAIVVSNAGFTRSAQQLAHSLGVLLIHYSELSALPSRLLLRG